MMNLRRYSRDLRMNRRALLIRLGEGGVLIWIHISEQGQILGCFGNVDHYLASEKGWTSRFASGLLNEQENPWYSVS